MEAGPVDQEELDAEHQGVAPALLFEKWLNRQPAEQDLDAPPISKTALPFRKASAQH